MAKKRPGKTTKEPMTVISIKTTEAFRDWLASVADAERSTIVQVLEKGAVMYGEAHGFKGAPRRTQR